MKESSYWKSEKFKRCSYPYNLLTGWCSSFASGNDGYRESRKPRSGRRHWLPWCRLSSEPASEAHIHLWCFLRPWLKGWWSRLGQFQVLHNTSQIKHLDACHYFYIFVKGQAKAVLKKWNLLEAFAVHGTCTLSSYEIRFFHWEHAPIYVSWLHDEINHN